MIFYGWMTFKKEGEELPTFLKFLLFFGVNGAFFFAWGVAFFFGKADLLDMVAHVGFLALGMLLVALTASSLLKKNFYLSLPKKPARKGIT